MAIQRTLTNALFLATLAVSAGYAAFSPTEAQAEKPYDCAADIENTAWAKGWFKAKCVEKKISTNKQMKDWMADLTKKKTIKVGGESKELTCKTCHTDGNGSKISTQDAYKWLDLAKDAPKSE